MAEKDREMLELAAKAAGYDHLVWTPGASPIVPGAFRVPDEKAWWNPLVDDGDALRLAVKLELAPSIFAIPGLTICTATNRPMSEVNIEEEHNGDPFGATRRAIVRAAAEIAAASSLDGAGRER